MGKAKKKRADFQKVKLKVGKKLKKADNVTNASFKSRSIQIAQQLKTADGSQPVTKKKQNITELFSHCRHYSASVRHEAVTGLKEILTSNPDLIQSHLSDVLEKCSELISDKDGVVRRFVIKNLLKYALALISEKQVAPFFPLVCAHLCCAMTHINDDIKVDSLLVLDMLLEHYPKLMISKSNQVLSNFIEQISRQGQGQKRSLTTNPNSETSSMQWRVSVMNRLQKFLQAILVSHTDESGHSENMDVEDVMMFECMDVNQVQMFPTYVRDSWEMPGFIYSAESKKTNVTQDKSAFFEGKFHEYASSLMPLILECWIEATPSGKTEDFNKHKTWKNKGSKPKQQEMSSSNMQYSIVKVTQLLWQCVARLDTSQGEFTLPMLKYESEFESLFLRNFPYVVEPVTAVDRKDHKKHANANPEQVSSETLNLTICDVMANFLPSHTSSAAVPDWTERLVQYMTQILSSRNRAANVGPNAKLIIKILKQFTQCQGDVLQDESGHKLMKAVFERYMQAKPLSQEKRVYIDFFASTMLQKESSDIYSEETKQRFLTSLPELLSICVKENSAIVPQIIGIMKQTGCENFMLLLGDRLLDTMDKFFNVETGVILSLKPHHQRELISFLYFVPVYDLELRQCVYGLIELCRSEHLADAEVKYLIQVLQNRYVDHGEIFADAMGYIGFMSGLVIGNVEPTTDTTEVNTTSLQTVNIVGTLPDGPVLSHSWQRHLVIVEAMNSAIQQCFNTHQVIQVLFCRTGLSTKKDNWVRLQNVYSVCKLAQSNPIPDELTPFLLTLSLSLVNAMVTCEPTANENAVRLMLDTGCGVIVKLADGVVTMLSKAIQICEDQGSSEDVVAGTIKIVMLFMKEDHRASIQSKPECVQLMRQLKTNLHSKLQQLIKVGVSQETEKLFATFDYHVSLVLK